MIRKLHKDGMTRLLLISTSLILLSGCSTYRSSFSCGDAKGASCFSMEQVGRMIESGEIEKYTESGSGCRGRRCKRNLKNAEEMLLPKTHDGYKVHHVSHHVRGMQ